MNRGKGGELDSSGGSDEFQDVRIKKRWRVEGRRGEGSDCERVLHVQGDRERGGTRLSGPPRNPPLLQGSLTAAILLY